MNWWFWKYYQKERWINEYGTSENDNRKGEMDEYDNSGNGIQYNMTMET